MSVRSLSEVVPGQATLPAAVLVFVFGAFVLVHAVNNLWLVATTPVNSWAEWMATFLIGMASVGLVLLSLKVIDRGLEGEA